MKLFGFEINKTKKTEPQSSDLLDYETINPQSMSYVDYGNIQSIYFDGEKTPYELGTPKDIILDYQLLRARSWQSFIESDVVQNVIKKYCLWIVGPGLKLQSQPNEYILGKKGISDTKTFIQDSENQFRLHARMNGSSYSGMDTLHGLAAEALKNAILAGDCLILQRFEGNKVTTELIDGYHIQTPIISEFHDQAKAIGNEIKEGVEINKKGTHIAFYISQRDLSYKRIVARGASGRVKAWLFYGMKHKINDVRGMSLLTAILETSAKMDRYKDAALGTAEENSKIPYTIEHNQFSTGEDPQVQQFLAAAGKNRPVAPETKSYDDCNLMATKIAQTTSKQTYNMPIGSTVKRNSWASDINFGEFFGVNIDIIYATIGIPAEVAMEKFGGSYSGSRAALKSWEYTMVTEREVKVRKYFYQPTYTYWLDINILQNNVSAPGYLKAIQEKDEMTLEAYRDSRFIGATVPHIDPVKEVMAERKKLGSSFDNYPLTTAEQASENLNTGDYEQTIKKAENEKKNSKFFDPDPVINNGTGSD